MAEAPRNCDDPNLGHEGDWAQPDLTVRPNTPVPDELAAVRAQMRTLKMREEELKALLIANPDVREGAGWIAEIKTVTTKRVDIRELRACHPDLVAEFTFPEQSTRVELSAITEDGEIVSARKMRNAAKSGGTQ